MELYIHRGFESVNVAGYKFSDLISIGEGDQLMAEVSMAAPLDSKEVVTTLELAPCNMLEIGQGGGRKVPLEHEILREEVIKKY